MRLLVVAATFFCALVLAGAAHGADERGSNRRVVDAVGDQRLPVRTSAGSGLLAFYASRRLDDGTVQADVERAVLVLHGRLRNADVYFGSAQKAAEAAGDSARRTLLIAPQFLDERDWRAHSLPAETLRWHGEGWEGGDEAAAPAPLSSFDALDAMLAALADKRRFPKLTQVVVAGHSGGGQVVQRYAVVGQGEAQLAARGVRVRYVVANPSSYLYFTADRPRGDGAFAPLPTGQCAAADQWKYGFAGAPAYAQRLTAADYERRYATRDVVYLLGGADTDPQHPALDKSCAGEAQGPFRLARGRNYASYLRWRQPQLRPVVHEVPGVGHEGDRMLGSACGRAALFDQPQGSVDCASR
jgi:pimeloyl-ACP methyl ester carboxylesterase